VKRLFSLCLGLALVASALAIASVWAHYTGGNPCADSGRTSAGAALVEYGGFSDPDAQIEFCLQYYPGVGDVNITGASGTGEFTLNLDNYNHMLLVQGDTWENNPNAIQLYGEDSCVTTKNSSGTTFQRKITRTRVQNQIFAAWDTIFDSNNPPVHGTYFYEWNLINIDTADRIIFNVASC